MNAFTVPASTARSTTFAARLNGAPIEVYSTGAADFILLAALPNEPFTLEVALPTPASTPAILKPLRLGIQPTTLDATVTCHFERPTNALLEIPGFQRLFLFTSTPSARPDPSAPGVHYFGGGKVHNVGLLRLNSNDTLYVEGGSVLRACIIAENASNIRIAGEGIIDGTRPAGAHDHPIILLNRCQHCHIENVTLIHPSTWMVILGGSQHIHVHNLHEIGEIVCSDGIDIVGSQNIEVSGGFFCNNDDCVVVKALHRNGRFSPDTDWRDDVRSVHIHGCSFYNLGAGNAMEIGFELRSNLIEDITFEDLDVLAAHQNAAVFSIHNGDHATVRNILYRDIRVEHYWNKLVDIRILRSRYSKDPEPGHVENIRFEHIHCIPNVFNTPSLIGGFDPTHLVRNVSFLDFRLGNTPITSAHQLELYSNCAENITFIEG